ncbi:hypothetical protein [Streptomyces sp. NPDC056549]|uniref:zinc finger domain-containing protein n=1 Tax=Streptomyces sp. NPDC056549 TaxID=3345864 RepID=UPI0036BC18E3
MEQQEAWGHWRPHFRSGESSARIRAWFRRVECTACKAEEGRACRTPAGYPTHHHKVRRDAAGLPPYQEWHEQGLLDDLVPGTTPVLAQAGLAARQGLNVDEPLGDAVALVRRSLADRYGRVLLDTETLDRLDHDVRALLLARGPEGSAEIVTILAAQIASLIMGAAPEAPDAAYNQMVTDQLAAARARQRLERLLDGLEIDQGDGASETAPEE